MEILNNIELQNYTTMKVGGPSRFFCKVTGIEELKQAVAFAKEKSLEFFVFGGGSNIIVNDRGYDGLAIQVCNKGLKSEEGDKEVVLTVGSGEVWDEVVNYCVRNSFWGLENLSHIPGQVGAVCVQNVGAYGQKAAQVVEAVKVFDIRTNSVLTLKSNDLGFGYRTSIFNSKKKGRYVILETTFRLSKQPKPNLGYWDLAKAFPENYSPSIAEIRQAIVTIRDKKFTLPDKIPNCGSFFKNQIISLPEYQKLEVKIKQNFGPTELSKLQAYRAKLTFGGQVKIPSAFLIDICGLKRKKFGGAKVNETQPLVILNTGNATADDVLNLMKIVRQIVFIKTSLKLGIEPELIGFTDQELDYYFKLD